MVAQKVRTDGLEEEDKKGIRCAFVTVTLPLTTLALEVLHRETNELNAVL